MELNGFISITIIGKTLEGFLNPKDIDIAETKELLSDVEILLFPTKAEKEDRPKVSYEVKEGSVKNIFFVPIANAIMFTALMSEAGKQGNTEILPSKAAAILDKWQKKSYSTGREYIFTSSVNENPFVKISSETKFLTLQADWVNTSLNLYGEIFEEGGLSKSNLHILTDRYGKLTVNATKDQLTSGTNKLYNTYGLWVKGKQNLLTGDLKDLTLIDFLVYEQNYDDISLNLLITKASVNWSKIKDKDSWLSDIKGGNDE